MGRAYRFVGGACLALALLALQDAPGRAGTTRDVRAIGLPFLYQALTAVANCPNLALDQAAFARVARLYHLAPIDFTRAGPYARVLAALDLELRIHIEDDRNTFCSANRLVFAVPHGVLVDRGPVVPHPLPPIAPTVLR